ncbi:MAG TPA: right-handed parallel beta-helix repeat-containing protein [Ramlibacter sp.]|nr:right-handed parallel beta-helix repeat-containing protein [Ramlibacter sp.]
MLASGLSVAIPSGVYMITGELAVRNGQVIAPAAGAEVTFKAAPGYTGRIMSTVDVSFTIRGIVFDGSYADRASLEGNTGANLLNIVGGSVTLENNRFQYAPATAVWAWRSAAIQVRGNTFFETYQPIRLDGANIPAGGGTIENNTFTNTAAFKSIQHIEAIYTDGLVIRGNTMRGAGLAEPSSHGYEGTWGNSIYLVNSNHYLVETNKVYSNYWSSLVSGSGSANGVIRGNYFLEGAHSSACMWIEQPGAAYITVDSNDLDGGISVGDTGGDHLTITRNTVHSRGVGIDVNSGAKDVLIQDNQFYSKAGFRNNNGMYLWQKSTPDVNVRVLNNHVQGFDKGIAINNSHGLGTVYGITLSRNTFADNNQNVWVPLTLLLKRPLGQ